MTSPKDLGDMDVDKLSAAAIWLTRGASYIPFWLYLWSISSAFAAISFSGDVVLGYAWSYDTDAKKVIEATYGEDGYDKDGFYAQLDATISDENGIVTATLDSDADLDTATVVNSKVTTKNGAYIGEEMGANVTVDIMKLFGVDSDFSLKLTGTYNDRVTGLPAYKTGYGFANLDRIRTGNGGNPLSLDFAYGSLVKANVAYVFDSTSKDSLGNGIGRDFLVSALVNPVDGVKVSAGFVLKGNSCAGGQTAGDGGFNAAVDVDIAKLADLDFDLGVAASYVGLFKDKTKDGDKEGSFGQTIAAVVYGGIDVVDAGLEFAYIDQLATDEDILALSVLVNINAVENLPISVYFAIGDLNDAADTIVVGATAEYELNGVGLGVAAEYVTGGSLYYSGANYATGFGVTGFPVEFC